MKLSNIVNAVFCEPWLIRPAMHSKIAGIVQAHVDGTAHQVGGIADLFAPEAEQKVPEIVDGVAVIPIEGVMGKRVSGIEKSSGVVDVDDIAEMIEWAEDESQVTAVVLDIDSPGGAVTGVPELAAQISSMAKPVIAYSETMAASGAYWVASAADAVYGSPSSVWGSIGVYLALLDQSRAYEMAGIKADVIKAGKFKAAGLPGTSLTEEQRAQLQARVDGLYDNFKSAVRAGRGNIADETMQGQDFYAPEAKAVGLIDSIAPLAKAIADARYMATR